MLQYVLFPFVLIQGMSTEPSSLRRIQFQYPINRLERKDSLKEINKLRAVPESSALPLTAQQRVILEWRMAAQSNFSQNLNVLPLDRVLKSDVVHFLCHHDPLDSRIGFEPYFQVNISSHSQDVLGKLFVPEPLNKIQSLMCPETSHLIVAAVNSTTKLLMQGSSNRMIVGNCIKEAEWIIGPMRRPIGDGVLDDEFGYPFPTLVMNVATSDSCDKLFKDLGAWISPETSVQVAIGFMVYTLFGGEKKETVQKVEAFVFRRNVQNPEQIIRLYPVQQDLCPVLSVHLRDLFFGVLHLLPKDLCQRISNDETIKIDLHNLQEIVVGMCG